MASARILLLLALAGITHGPVLRAQLPSDVRTAAATPADPAARQRALYFTREHESAYRAGRAAAASLAGDPAARAWWIANTVESGRVEEAVGLADAFVREAPRERWAAFAQALVLARAARRTDDMLAAAARAHAAAPSDPDMIWLEARALYAAHRGAAAARVLDSALARVTPTPALLTLRGETDVLAGWRSPPDTVLLRRAQRTYERALALDSTWVPAELELADLLGGMLSDPAGAYLHARRAAALAPRSPAGHWALWRAIQARRDVPVEAKHQEILADADGLRRAAGEDPAALAAVAGAYEWMGVLASADSVEARVLALDPDGPAGETVLAERIRRVQPHAGAASADSETVARERRRLMWQFVQRPKHADAGLLGRQYTQLVMSLMADSAASADELARAVEGAARFDREFPQIASLAGPVALVDRGASGRSLDAAERVARAAPVRFAEFVKRRPYYRLSDFDAQAHDALGWVLLARGRLAAARAELQKAAEVHPGDPQVLYHLGRLEEKAGNLAAAERRYQRGMAAEAGDSHQRNRAALRKLYAARHGSADGFGHYLAELDARNTAARRDSILADRVRPARPAPTFTLQKVGGGRVSGGSLRGRVVVMNFWYIGCAPCQEEMPAIAQLARRYRDSSDVAFFTVDTEDAPDSIAAFLAARKLELPVLIDGGLSVRAGVGGMPTTWFIDRAGRIVYEATGSDGPEATLEAFTWRIEALRAEKATAKSASGS